MKNIGKTICEYRKKTNMTQKDLSEALAKLGCSVSSKAVSAWESGQTTPPLETFFAICQVLGIKDIYKAFCEGALLNPISEKKDSFQKAYSRLNQKGRDRAEEYVSLLLKDSAFRLAEKPSPVISMSSSCEASVSSGVIRLYDMPVSAGTGNFLEESTFEELQRTEAIPSAASFGVKISGDSMEPRFHSGQSVWVKQQETLENGEIGIFLLDGSAYCKKLKCDASGTYLVSLNKAYPQIPVVADSNLIIFGKVL